MAAAGIEALKGPKKQKIQLAMEEAELRSLRIPSSANRGALSPSKNSFLPTLQEQAQERMQKMNKRHRQRRTATGGGAQDVEDRQRSRLSSPQEFSILSEISVRVLDCLKQDFMSCGGVLNLDQFSRATLRNLALPANVASARTSTTETRKTPRSERSNKSVSFEKVSEDCSVPETVSSTPQEGAAGESPKAFTRAAAVIDLFERIDVHAEGSITWDEVSNYLIDQGMAGRDEFTVDNIKAYEPSTSVDLSKQEGTVEKLLYVPQMDAVVCLSKDSKKFRLYDPKRLIKKHEVSGHRGTVINCCYVEAFGQLATTSSDMTVCLWDATHLGLRNRMTTKDVQLCLQWDEVSKSLFSGSIDGTLCRWDLQQMCLADTRRGQHRKPINDLLMIQDLNLLASASSDGNILMWDCSTMKPKKKFGGHKKGTFSLAYSMDYHCLLTAGLDQEALVWNPYVERVPIFRLKEHTHALCGVAVVPGTPQIISADVEGNFKLWDMRNFRCVQSFGASDTMLNTFCAIPTPTRKMLVAGGTRVSLYEYMDEWGGESVTDSGGVTDALYNPSAGCFYTVSHRSVKAWNAASGQLFKVLRDISGHEITAACLADNCRKLYLGDASGRVGAHGLNNGALITDFDAHKADISCLGIWKGTNRLFSTSWDGTLKIHSDESSRTPQIKAEFQHHRDGVTCLACSPELRLLATGGMDMQVVLYDLRNLKLEYNLARFHHVIAGVDFLPLRCLLAVADQGGLVSLWRVRPHAQQWTCIFHFSNFPVIEGQLATPGAGSGTVSEHGVSSLALRGSHPIPVNGLCFASEAADEKVPPWLYTADAKGCLRCWDLSVVFERLQIVHSDLEGLFEWQRSGQPGGPRCGGGGESISVELTPRPVASQVASAAVATTSPPSGYPPPHLSSAGSVGGSVGGGGSDTGGGSFLTGVDVGNSHGARGEVSPALQITTVRAMVSTSNVAIADSPSIERASGQDRWVELLFEVDAHSDAALKLKLTSKPAALISCGLDRRVRAWTPKLEPCGVLLQSRDRAFKFQFDATVARNRELDAGRELLDRMGPIVDKSKLPKLMTPRTPAAAAAEESNPQDILAQLGTHGRRRQARRKDADAMWKDTAERVIADPDADEEDYRILFEQMERAGESAQNRLVHHANSRHADRMRHRATALSRDEASAAERLARAMKALGGDEFGTYFAMARSLDPRVGGVGVAA
eukprot:TRINITY_DN17272_c0_g1_i1.p1 TRINITY_DN17272_c0_g1~~TRINITY_DN17272_c0_g1_i1.p1  ORF type:complete len:1207 (+),score=224.15 TRINITY_DN17272_c0_g1_i1:283-3903(+)